MHIAILFYGRIDKFKVNHSNLIESLGSENTFDFFYSGDNEPENLVLEFNELYKPIKICNDQITDTIEDQLCKYNNPPSFLHCLTNIHNMTRHFINKGRVFKLLEDYIEQGGAKYDLVFSTRIDLFYNEPIHFKDIQENTIYIPEGYEFAELAVCDQFAYGSLEIMKKYMNLYENIIGFLDQNAFLHPESLHFWNIRHHNINIVKYPFSFVLIR